MAVETSGTESGAFGFIGLGAMGAPMSRRVIDASHRVLVNDASQDAIDRVVAAGGVAAGTPREVAAVASTIFLSLPNGDIVQQVLLGEQGVVQGNAVRRVIDFSTIGARAAKAIGPRLAERGIDYVDAPVSGGLAGAREGRLAIMVSCPNAVFSLVAETLGLFGKPFHVGQEFGQAQTLKLANNLLNVAAVALTSEAMVMGVKAGLDPAQMLEIINAGTGRNSATTDKFPRSVLTGTFDYGFSTGLSYKDVSLCVDEAEALGVPMVLGAAVRQMFAVTNALHGPSSDFTSVCRVVESWAHVEVRQRSS